MVPPTIYHHARAGTIPCVRIGGRIRFDWSVVSQLFFPEKELKTSPTPPADQPKPAEPRLEVEAVTPPGPGGSFLTPNPSFFGELPAVPPPRTGGNFLTPNPSFSGEVAAVSPPTRSGVNPGRKGPEGRDLSPIGSLLRTPIAVEDEPTGAARRPGPARVRHAILSPGDLSSAQVAAALQLSAALHLQPMVVTEQGLAGPAGFEPGVSLVFLSVEHIQQAGTSATLSHLLAWASARPAKVLVAVLVSSPALLAGLQHLPPGLPVILCPLYHLGSSLEVLINALTHLVLSRA
jgi:hypothetical protein